MMPMVGAGGRALVTGIRGFTGRYVAAELERAGYEVHGLRDGENRVDLLDAVATRRAVSAIRPDVVVHLAAISFVEHDDVEAIYRVNIIGTRNLLAALASGPAIPRAVLLASSANVYGNADVESIDEETPVAPVNDYAVSKLAMEHMSRLWLDKLPVIIARPFNYSGVGQSESFLLPKIVGHYRRRAAVIELGNLDVVRDFSDVRVVAARYRALLASGVPGEVYNICSGRAYSPTEVLELMADITGYRMLVRVNPTYARRNEVRRLSGSRDKLDQATGQLDDIPLVDTLRWMLEVET